MGKLSKNDFEEQSQYQEKEYKQNASKLKFTRESIKDELNKFENASIDGVESGASKNKLIIIGIIGVILIIIIALVVMISLGGGNVKEVSEEAPKRYSDPDIITQNQIGYTQEQIEELRAYGYTGDEIEQYELNGDDPETLISLAQEKMRKKLQDEYSFLINNIEPKEQEVWIKNSFFVNPKSKEPNMVKEDSGEFLDPVARQIQENVDYWKVPLHGNQAFLKLKLKSGEIVFTQIPIARYKTLRDFGNIVISYDRLDIDGQTFIQSIYEISSETPGLN